MNNSTSRNGALHPPIPVDPTALAEQTWQVIWLASGEEPETCLASFIEILIFKYLSDLGLLERTPDGLDVSFPTVYELPADQCLRYYFTHVRPEIKRLFPPGPDGTSVINGIVLNPENADHGRLFAQILQRFERAGSFRRIDPEFKSRVFEKFLKESISKKNLGQFFTPRNVVKAMVEMSGIGTLTPGSVVADPACGVGGFLLEPLLHRRAGDHRSEEAASLVYRGWDRDTKTIILAKANMLIHLSEVLENDPTGAPTWLAPILSASFTSMATSITGSLSIAPVDEFDLVMTNPPYVVAGTRTQRAMIAADPRLAEYYGIRGSGVENLFIQLIINGLKPGARALVIIPYGLLLRHSEEDLKRFMLEKCVLEAIVSLPINTFYSTPKKTYILVVRKKIHNEEAQGERVFTYLMSNVGETLDAKRFPISENDLPGMARLFRLFQGAPDAFNEPDDEPRLKLQPIERFNPSEHWLVDRWWSEQERQSLGVVGTVEAIQPNDLAERLQEVARTTTEIAELVRRDVRPPEGVRTRSVRLGDKALFRLSIGTRVLKRDLHGLPKGPIPLYSANVQEPFGFIAESNIDDFTRPSILWGIDGDFKLAVKRIGEEFATTDHCGRIELLVDDLDPSYCRAAIALARAYGFDRTLRPSLQRVRTLAIAVPVTESGDFDVEAQRALAERYDAVLEGLAEARRVFDTLAGLEPDVMLSEIENDEDIGDE